MTIFEALRISHDMQRELAQKLVETQGDTPERHALFAQLKQELAVHSVAEERHFYVPLMQQDAGVDLSRHAIAEHHQMDEMIEDLEATDPSDPSWLAQAKALAEKVEPSPQGGRAQLLPDGRQALARQGEGAAGR
jgi:iron-sulfur cluster repair protein YtfE (RIC family)